METCAVCETSKIQDIVFHCSQCQENMCEDCNHKYPESYDCGDSEQWRCRKCELKTREAICDVCGDATIDPMRVTDENWEYCFGLQKQFCGVCRENREEEPCDNPDCEADVCYNAREESE